MDFTLDTFYADFFKARDFRAYIYTPSLVKTRLDLVYTDMVNWERSGLLDIDYGVDIDKTGYKSTAICFMEYVWMSIVSHLREFGFSYEDIKDIGFLLTQPITLEVLKARILQNPQYFERTYDDSLGKKAIGAIINTKQSDGSYITLLESLVKDTILHAQNIRLLFFKYPSAFEIVNKSVLEELSSRDNNDGLEAFQTAVEKPHFSFSLSGLTQKFVQKKTDYTKEQIMILNQTDHKILTLIRKQHKALKSVTIRYKDKSPTMIELTSMHKAQAEKRLVEYIKKGSYMTMEFKVENGDPLIFNRTEKHKL